MRLSGTLSLRCELARRTSVLANPLRKNTVSSVSFADETSCDDDADGLYYADGWSVPTEDLPSSADPSSSGTSAPAVPAEAAEETIDATMLAHEGRRDNFHRVARSGFREAWRTAPFVRAVWQPGLTPALPQPQAGVTADASA